MYSLAIISVIVGTAGLVVGIIQLVLMILDTQKHKENRR